MFKSRCARNSIDARREGDDGAAMELFATAAKGTEGAVRDELRELRFRGVRATRGGVTFEGDMGEAFRACLSLRTAVRVLWLLDRFEARDGDALYEGVRGVDWAPFLDATRTMAVRSYSKDSALSHTQFIAQRTKDAVVDQLRSRTGSRPSVDLADPDVVLFVHVVRDECAVYLDLAGEPLHRRGYRRDQGPAPLKEALAAAVLRLSGWDRKRPLIDPMCGSGTIAIEGALWARNIAPGLLRERYGFERWRCHGDEESRAVRDVRERLRSAVLPRTTEILASDIDVYTVAGARANAEQAGIAGDIRFGKRDVRAIQGTTPPGHVVVNPPYGERLSAEEALYRDAREAFRRLIGHQITVLAGGPEAERMLPFWPSKRLFVYNGPLPCALVTCEVQA